MSVSFKTIYNNSSLISTIEQIDEYYHADIIIIITPDEDNNDTAFAYANSYLKRNGWEKVKKEYTDAKQFEEQYPSVAVWTNENKDKLAKLDFDLMYEGNPNYDTEQVWLKNENGPILNGVVFFFV